MVLHIKQVLASCTHVEIKAKLKKNGILEYLKGLDFWNIVTWINGTQSHINLSQSTCWPNSFLYFLLLQHRFSHIGGLLEYLEMCICAIRVDW